MMRRPMNAPSSAGDRKPLHPARRMCPRQTAYPIRFSSLMSSPHLASRRWIWEQYDHMVMGDTIVAPWRRCRRGPRSRNRQSARDELRRHPALLLCRSFRRRKAGRCGSLAQSHRIGAKPLALTDCMNFGNPERPEIMGEFVSAVEGMAEACRALDFPVVSGNVSLYNETNGVAIPPTPAIGGVGLILDIAKIARDWRCARGRRADPDRRTGAAIWANRFIRRMRRQVRWCASPVDLAAERSMAISCAR